MILRLIASFGILLISMYLGIWLQRDPGYVLISFQHWTIESSFWIAIIAIIILLILLQIGFSIIKNMASMPHYWQQWRNTNRLSRAQAKTKRGLIEFSEGQWQTAKKHLIAGAANTDQPLVNYLTAAKAAEKLGDHHLRDHYLHLAQTAAPDATIAIELTQAQLQIDNHEWQEASATLDALQIIAPDHSYVLQLCLELYQATHNWTDVIAILPKLKPNKKLSALDIHDIKKKAYLALLHEGLAQPNPAFDINQAIQTLPKDLKHDPDIIVCYARYLVNNHQDLQAEKYIRDSLKHAVNSDLLALYSEINNEYTNIPFIESLIVTSQVRHPERSEGSPEVGKVLNSEILRVKRRTQDDVPGKLPLIKRGSHSAALHLCLGKLFFAKQVWGSARTHLEKSIQIQPSMQAYYALGTLLEALEQPAEACDAYRLGLEYTKDNSEVCGYPL